MKNIELESRVAKILRKGIRGREVQDRDENFFTVEKFERGRMERQYYFKYKW